MMNLGSVRQTTPKGPRDRSTVLLRRALEITWCPTTCRGGGRWLGAEQVFIFLYQPLWTCLVLQGLTVIEQDLFCSLSFVCVTRFAPFWLTLAWRSSSYCVQEKLHQTRCGGTSACERKSRISAEMGILATQAVCLMIYSSFFTDCPGRFDFCQSRLTARHS